MKNEKKKIRTQNIHEFRSSFILNMNKKEYKSRKFNHNNTNLEKKNYRQETFLAFSYSYNQTQITSKNIQPNTTKTSQTHTHTLTHKNYGDLAMVAHLFPICHGRATPSLISSAYSFACGSIFLAFLILQNFVPLVLGFFAFVFSRGCGVFFILWVYCVFVSQENFWIYGFARDLVSYCVCFPKFLCKSIFVAFLQIFHEYLVGNLSVFLWKGQRHERGNHKDLEFFFFFFFSMELLGLFLLVLVVFGWMFLLVICVWL